MDDDKLDTEQSGDVPTPPAAESVVVAPEKPNMPRAEPTTKSTAHGSCYCGKERNLNIVELLCMRCLRWFHESCISYQMGKVVTFATNYIFCCKNCTHSGVEKFRRTQAPFPNMCVTAIASLQQNALRQGSPRTMFIRDKEIIPYIDQHWESMTTMNRRLTQSWHATVQRTLVKESSTLFKFNETEDGVMYGLINPDLRAIKPNYDAIVKASASTGADDGSTQVPTFKGGRQRRKLLGGDTLGPNKKGRPNNDCFSHVKLPPHGYPLEHPYNKDGYRYFLAEPDPHAPFRQEFDESADWAGKPIPGWLYRRLVPQSVLLALHDRAPQLKVAEDRLSVIGDRGYCMIRATHSVNRGRWYYEINIEDMPEGAATRVGWGRRHCNLQAPVGYDKFGYSWRSKKGTLFHCSRGRNYKLQGYGEGDVLGVMIDLPENTQVDYLPPTFKDRPLVKFKSHLYYEAKDEVAEATKNLRALSKSKIEFFRNGEYMGVAFEDLYAGSYYPSIAIYKNATVRANFGPNFKYPDVLTKHSAHGMCERVEDLIAEQSLSDLLYLTENEGKLRLDNIRVGSNKNSAFTSTDR